MQVSRSATCFVALQIGCVYTPARASAFQNPSHSRPADPPSACADPRWAEFPRVEMTMHKGIGSPRAKAFEEDITLAAMSLVPVLITAPPADAFCIVRAIAERERRGRTREVLACDASAGDDV